MSHFTVMVIGENPEEQLAPYSEHIEVEPYVINEVSERDKARMVEHYTSQYPEHQGKTYDELYPIFGDDWDGGYCKKNKDDVWEEWSTYNPKSKWDWYSLGGRWSGLIQLKEGAIGITGTPGVGDNQVGIDQARKGDIANFDELKTFVIVKDGKWYEQGEMGYWAIVISENENWEKESADLLADIPDDTLISIYDCHI